MAENYRSHAARLNHLHNLRTRSLMGQQGGAAAAGPPPPSPAVRLTASASMPSKGESAVRLLAHDERTHSPSSGNGRAARKLQLMVGQLEQSEARLSVQLDRRAEEMEAQVGQHEQMRARCLARLRARVERQLLARAYLRWRGTAAQTARCRALLARGFARLLRRRLRLALQAWHRESCRAQAAFIRSSRRELHELEENRIRTKAARFAKREAEKAFEDAKAELRAVNRAHAEALDELDVRNEQLADCKRAVGMDDLRKICAELGAARHENAALVEATGRANDDAAQFARNQRELEQSLAKVRARFEEAEIANEQLRKDNKILQADVRKLRVELDGAVAATRRAVQTYGRTLKTSEGDSPRSQRSAQGAHTVEAANLRNADDTVKLTNSTVKELRLPANKPPPPVWSPPTEVLVPEVLGTLALQKQAKRDLLELVPHFEAAKSHLCRVDTRDSSSPKLDPAEIRLDSAQRKAQIKQMFQVAKQQQAPATANNAPAERAAREHEMPASRVQGEVDELKGLLTEASMAHEALSGGAERLQGMAMTTVVS
eukprot:SAG22_NODE_2967_length_2064_cov_4.104835_1_plen_546_part_10